MVRRVQIDSYEVSYAACSQGFNEWRKDIYVYSADHKDLVDIRFVDDIHAPVVTRIEKVVESGASTTYLPSSEFHDVLELLRTEKPVYMTLYPPSRVLIGTGYEPPGEEEGLTRTG